MKLATFQSPNLRHLDRQFGFPKQKQLKASELHRSDVASLAFNLRHNHPVK